MAQQEGYVQLSEPAEVVERLPAASHVTFEPPSNFGATPQYPTAAAAQSAPGTSYPNVGPPPPPPITSTMSVGVPMDLNNDGRADAIGYDTTGDGEVDCIKLLGNVMPPAQPPPGQASGQAADGSQLVELVVPPHVTAGMQVVVQSPDGGMCKVVIPSNVPPGSRLRVQMPAQAAQAARATQSPQAAQAQAQARQQAWAQAQARQQQEVQQQQQQAQQQPALLVDVIIPPGATPGQQLLVQAPDGSTCKATVSPPVRVWIWVRARVSSIARRRCARRP